MVAIEEVPMGVLEQFLWHEPNTAIDENECMEDDPVHSNLDSRVRQSTPSRALPGVNTHVLAHHPSLDGIWRSPSELVQVKDAAHGIKRLTGVPKCKLQ